MADKPKRTKAQENLMADRGCAKEAAELLHAVNARRYVSSEHDTLRLLLRAREAVADLVKALEVES